MWIKLLLIFIGGGFGSIGRYLGGEWMHAMFGRAFPYGTLFVNIIGSLLIGFLVVLLFDRVQNGGDIWLALLVTGFLGGFTTFSGFSLDTFKLLYDANYLLALTNVVGNVALCLIAITLGFYLAKVIL